MTLIQKIETAILLWAFWALAGCHSLTPAQQARADKFECQAAALAPLVEPTLDAADLLHDLYSGSANLGAVLSRLEIAQDEADALIDRLRACEPPVPLPAPESLTPARHIAPPPAYGNKVI